MRPWTCLKVLWRSSGLNKSMLLYSVECEIASDAITGTSENALSEEQWLMRKAESSRTSRAILDTVRRAELTSRAL